MMAPLRAALGVLLLVGASRLEPSAATLPEPISADTARRVNAPLEALLAQLAPEPRALLALGLWVAEEPWGAPGPAAPPRVALAEGLLRQFPDLQAVRVDLARWYLDGLAPIERNPSVAEAYVAEGLRLLDEGLAWHPSTELHAVLGRQLAEADERVREVAERLFGDRVEELAIAELRRARELPRSRQRLAGLLIQRGAQSLERFGDHASAARDLAEAEALLSDGGDPHVELVRRQLDDLRARLSGRPTEDRS